MVRAIGLILFGALAMILFSAFFSASTGQGIQIAGVAPAVAGGQSPVADYIVIAGRLSDAVTKEWLNNYAVIPFEDNFEVTTPQTRSVTDIGEHPFSGAGVHDGFFQIKIPNRYKLTIANSFLNKYGQAVPVRYIDKGSGAYSELFIWLPEVHPGDIFCLEVEEKQLELAVVAMPVDIAHMSDDIRQNKTVLIDMIDNYHVRPEPGIGTGGIGPSPTDAFGLDSREVYSRMWKRPFTAPDTMTDREVFDQYVAPTTPDISYEQFRSQLRTFNANIKEDYTFLKGESYYIPLPSAAGTYVVVP